MGGGWVVIYCDPQQNYFSESVLMREEVRAYDLLSCEKGH